jgi:hypothetical protein
MGLQRGKKVAHGGLGENKCGVYFYNIDNTTIPFLYEFFGWGQCLGPLQIVCQVWSCGCGTSSEEGGQMGRCFGNVEDMGAQLEDVLLGNTRLKVKKVGGIGILNYSEKPFKTAISKEHIKGTVMRDERSCLEVVSSEEMLETLIKVVLGCKIKDDDIKSIQQRLVMERIGVVHVTNSISKNNENVDQRVDKE